MIAHSSTYTRAFVSILEVAFSVMVKWHYNVFISIPRPGIQKEYYETGDNRNGVELIKRITMSLSCDMGYNPRREIPSRKDVTEASELYIEPDPSLRGTLSALPQCKASVPPLAYCDGVRVIKQRGTELCQPLLCWISKEMARGDDSTDKHICCQT